MFSQMPMNRSMSPAYSTQSRTFLETREDEQLNINGTFVSEIFCVHKRSIIDQGGHNHGWAR